MAKSQKDPEDNETVAPKKPRRRRASASSKSAKQGTGEGGKTTPPKRRTSQRAKVKHDSKSASGAERSRTHDPAEQQASNDGGQNGAGLTHDQNPSVEEAFKSEKSTEEETATTNNGELQVAASLQSEAIEPEDPQSVPEAPEQTTTEPAQKDGEQDAEETQEDEARSDAGPAIEPDSEPTTPSGAGQKASGIAASATAAFLRPLNKLANGMDRSLHAVAKIRLFAAAVIAAIAVLAFTPGFTTIPPVDRDESRFSQASRQMVATGDYVDIRFQNGPRYQKPIGIYWLQSIALNIYGSDNGQAPIWVYRTVSFVGAVAAALLVYWLALAFGAPPVALAAGVLVALTILLGAEARLAKTDAMLFATIIAAQGVLARASLGRRDSAVKFWHVALFWTSAGIGILIKGPILPMVVGTTAVLACVFDRKVAWLRRLRPTLGVMWMLIITLPWFIAIGITSAGQFYELSIGQDLFEKIGQSRERPFVPPGAFTFGFFPALGWPLAPLAFLAIPFAIASWHDKSTRFLVAWIVPTWVIFELAATKLPHYILPIYPALAILAARMVIYEKIPTGWLAAIPKVLFTAIPLLATIGMPIVLYVYGDAISPLGTALMVLGMVTLGLASLYLWQRKATATLVTTVVGTLLLYQGAFGFHVPSARTIWITPQLVAALDGVQCEDPGLATLGYNEPSLVLMTRTDLRTLSSGEDAAEFLAGEGCRVAFVEQRFVEEMVTTLAVLQEQGQQNSLAFRLLGSVDGININGGDELVMQVFATGER